ncbi:MAG: Uma2 family endonuclease [Pirellulaceae bacterium]|nr:Uma2 family endonuclease [Pirellulaceae bacterium]
MATDTLPTVELPLVVADEVRPDVEHLVTEDDTPVDNVYSEKQQRLLTEPLYSSPAWAGEGRRFIALANVGLFYAVRRPPYVPDMLLSLDVELPADLWPKAHRSYFVWEYGKPPDAIVEVVSNDEGGEDDEKLVGYAKIGVSYYVIYDPQQMLGDQTLRGFGLHATGYRPLDELRWLPGIELGLDLWQGQYEGHEDTWLRWIDAAGQPILTGAERAEREQQRAERERQRAERERQRAEQEGQRAEREGQRAEREGQRAEQERQRAERLAEQLRRLGEQPEA